MTHLRIVLALLASVSSAQVSAADRRIPDYIRPEHARVVSLWLADNATLRVATDEDCQCAPALAHARAGYGGKTAPRPDMHPHYVVGDFNLDGVDDLAIGVVGRNAGFYDIAIFHGPLDARHDGKPGYFGSPQYLGYALHYGPPHPKPHQLEIGIYQGRTITLRHGAQGYVVDYPQFR